MFVRRFATVQDMVRECNLKYNLALGYNHKYNNKTNSTYMGNGKGVKYVDNTNNAK